MNYLIFLFYAMGSGSIFAIVFFLFALLSLAYSNIGDIIEIGAITVIPSILFSVILQGWHDDTSDVRSRKNLFKQVWNVLMVMYYTWLLFLSSAYFISFTFMVSGFVSIMCMADEAKGESRLNGVDKGYLGYICSMGASIWTFIGTIAMAKMFNRWTDSSAETLVAPNINAGMQILWSLPFLGLALFILIGLIWYMATKTYNILFDFHNTVNGSSSDVSRWGSKTWYEYLSFYLPVPLAHVIAFITARYLTHNNEFIIYVTNFQISEVELPEYISAISIIIVALCVIFVIGQKIIKSAYGSISLSQITLYSGAFFVLFFVLSVAYPYCTAKVTDSSAEIAAKIKQCGYASYDLYCPACQTSYRARKEETGGMYMGYGNKTISCIKCESEWYINKKDTIK